jgi:hypothetical protein
MKPKPKPTTFTVVKTDNGWLMYMQEPFSWECIYRDVVFTKSGKEQLLQEIKDELDAHFDKTDD